MLSKLSLTLILSDSILHKTSFFYLNEEWLKQAFETGHDFGNLIEWISVHRSLVNMSRTNVQSIS
jgi:hypothetical protein